jgi:maltose alpha-D-glucosyltransferase / alpha-amylase
VNQRLFHALATGKITELVKALEKTRELPPTAQWAQFLRNHDELDLGRLTDEQREEVFARFGPEEKHQLYHRGIRRRLAPMLGSRQMMELAYSLVLALPGTPVLRYGDEIGMGDDLSLNERDAVRTPMQWSPRPGAGFSSAKKLVHPMIEEGVYGCAHVNVEDQKRESDSLLRWMTRMIRLRKECPEIGWGEWEILDTGSPHLLAMRFEWRGNSILTLHNFSDHAEDGQMVVNREGGENLVDLIEHRDSEAVSRRRHDIALEAHGYRWFRVGTLDHHLTRRPERPEDSEKPGTRKKSRRRA